MKYKFTFGFWYVNAQGGRPYSIIIIHNCHLHCPFAIARTCVHCHARHHYSLHIYYRSMSFTLAASESLRPTFPNLVDLTVAPLPGPPIPDPPCTYPRPQSPPDSSTHSPYPLYLNYSTLPNSTLSASALSSSGSLHNCSSRKCQRGDPCSETFSTGTGSNFAISVLLLISSFNSSSKFCLDGKPEIQEYHAKCGD